VLIDYLELLDLGNGIQYNKDQERFRRKEIAERLKNLAVEFKLVISTVTQANNVAKEIWDNPTEVMTRENIAEAKALVDPMSFFFTLNRTRDETSKNILRIFTDKIRDYKGNRVITIKTAYDFDKFYDHFNTMKFIHNKQI